MKTPGTFEELRTQWYASGKGTVGLPQAAWDAGRASSRDAAARFVNPWTVEIRNKQTGAWHNFPHNSPLTLRDAEKLEEELKAENPGVTSRVVPWLNPEQEQHVRASRDEEVRQLREALEPFDKLYFFDGHKGRSNSQMVDIGTTIKALRNVRAALAATQDKA